MKGKVLVKGLVLLVSLFMLSVPNVMAQEPCTADFDCNQTVDAEDVTTFLTMFGRNQYNDPCPDCYDSPCPCPDECISHVCDLDTFMICMEGGGDCACCIPEFHPYSSGKCMSLDGCLNMPPHPFYGFYFPLL